MRANALEMIFCVEERRPSGSRFVTDSEARG
jgi:hypothetical protein